ncbi:MAG TPA: glycosyltransferase family 9 protein [Chthoniobacterales bacterium]|nr:glycosyltransferase family 9 protein [Chthoniobacterales bacterium]
MNILLIQLKRIGDLILTTPAIAAVREKFPDARITLVISSEGKALAPAIAGVNKLLVMPRGLNGFGTAVAVARGKFDYCVDFTRNDRSALLVFLSRAKKRIVSFRIKVRSKFRTRFYNEFVEHRMRDMHTIDYHLGLLEPLGISNVSRAARLKLPKSARETTDELLSANNVRRQFLVFHPGSARAEKFWNAQRWADVINHVADHHDVDLVLTGGSSPLEQTHIGDIKSKVRHEVLDLSGKTDLLTLAALIAKARLLTTVDSAPMHLASASRTPQVILFGPTNPFHWRPRESPALILQGTSTSPFTEFVPKQPRLPMNQISTQAVIDAMETLLSAPATSPRL